MKKALILFGVIALGACAGGLFGQETQKPYSYTFDKGFGNCTFTGVSFDQVWTATIQALILDKFQITVVRKDWGAIAAESDFHFTLKVELKGLDVCVVSSIIKLTEGQFGRTEDEHKAEKKLYNKVAELLYGGVEKK